jgi:cell division septation protein DedD
MDNAMVKRGIGAIVLAVIAALLLGYLLKDKSDKRQDVVEMKLPGAPEMNIPSLTGSLTGSTDNNTETPTLLDSAKAKLDGATDTVTSSGSAIIASATGAASKATDAVNNTATTAMDSTSAAIQGMKPGFAIRPSLQNEQKEIVDNTNTSKLSAVAPKIEQATDTAKNTVVASAKKVFKPQIVEKKPKKPAKPAKPVAKKEAPKQAKAPANTSVSATPLGKYSIQLLATSSQSRANKLAKTMKGEGYKVFVTQATRSDKVLYRVRVGGHSNRTGAIKAQEGMKRRYQKNFFVQNSLVISN